MSESVATLPAKWNIVGDSFLAHYAPETYTSQDAEGDPNNISKIKIKLEDIQSAHTRIMNDVIETPLIKAKHIGKPYCNIFFKCENLQNTGSFKARGACNVLSRMTPADKAKGCTIAGGRNFRQAMTYYGHKYSVPINVILPKDCSLVDKQRCRENFAIVKVHGNNNVESSLHALTYSQTIGTTYVHSSDRSDLIAGYGTLGLELLTQLDKLDAVLCPVGSGDLLASVIVAVKTLKPSCLVYGVESNAVPTMTKALQENKPVIIQSRPSIADSLSNIMASSKAFNVVRGYLDKMITVEDSWIARAMMSLFEREKMVVEGASACPIAALMAGKMPELRDKNVVCIITGGNIASSQLSQIIERGMVVEGRLIRFCAVMADAPGAMARLLYRISETGADVKSVVPNPPWIRPDVFTVCANILIETSNANHAKDLEKKLLKDYPRSHIEIM